MPVNIMQRKYYKFVAKKITRLLSTKYSAIAVGHYASIYQTLGRFLSQSLLEKYLQKIIHKANTSNSPYLGRGYNCIGKNALKQDDIYPLKRTYFEKEHCNIVNRAEVILTQQYGNYLSMPPEQQRTMRHCKELIPEL